MATEISNLKRIIRHNLTSDPKVFGLVDRRVFTAHGRDADEATRNHPTLIAEFRSGGTFRSAPVGRRILWLYGYSNIHDAHAGEVYEAAKAVLQREGLPGPPDESGDPCFPQCGYFEEQDGELHMFNRDVGAWFVRGTWVAWQFG